MSDDEITITPEMIEAGKLALDRSGNLPLTPLFRIRTDDDIIKSIYRAMRALEPPTLRNLLGTEGPFDPVVTEAERSEAAKYFAEVDPTNVRVADYVDVRVILTRIDYDEWNGF